MDDGTRLCVCVRARYLIMCVCGLADITSKTVLIRVVKCLPLGRVSASLQGISLLTDTLILYSSSCTHVYKCTHTHKVVEEGSEAGLVTA